MRTVTLGILITVVSACGACRTSRSSDSHSSASPREVDKKAQKAAPIPKEPLDPRTALVAPTIARLLESQHLRGKRPDDKISAKAFDTFLSALDHGKLFLLQEHVEKLRAYRLDMDDEIRSGRLTLVQVGMPLLRRRIEVLKKTVVELLSQPFDYDRDEKLETDPDKYTWAPDEKALRERWRKTLKLDVLERVRRMERKLASLKDNLGKGGGKKKRANAKAAEKKGAEKHGGGEGATSGEKKARAALERAAAKIPKTAKGREKKARTDIAKRYAGRFARRATSSPLDGLTMFVNAVASQYDPHTGYLPPATKENFDIHMSGSLEGIGAVLQEDDHYIRVVRIVPGGASWRQGELDADDLILAVAQGSKEPVDIVDERIDRVVRLIRGPKGSVVTLTVKKPDGRVKVIPITRDVIKIEAAYARGAVLERKEDDKADKIGYIDLPSFYGNTRTRRGRTPKRRAGHDVREVLRRFVKRKVTGVIIDLRGNGGGLLDDAREITGLFIKSGPIVQTHGRTGEVEVLRDRDDKVVFAGQVIVMVDRSSASASEIVAGALQDYRRALIVGTGATHGKGTVQVLIGLDRLLHQPGNKLGALKLTRYQFFRVTGDSTQLRGVVPNVKLVDPVAFIEGGERRLDNALAWSHVDAVPFKRWPKPAWNTATLAAHSKARQAKVAVFAKFKKRNALLEAQRKQTIVPLQRDKWRAWIKKRRKQLEQTSPDLSEAPVGLRVRPVVYAKGSTPVKPRPGHKTSGVSSRQRWKESVERDPWVTEATAILHEMLAAE